MGILWNTVIESYLFMKKWGGGIHNYLKSHIKNTLMGFYLTN